MITYNQYSQNEYLTREIMLLYKNSRNRLMNGIEHLLINLNHQIH